MGRYPLRGRHIPALHLLPLVIATFVSLLMSCVLPGHSRPTLSPFVIPLEMRTHKEWLEDEAKEKRWGWRSGKGNKYIIGMGILTALHWSVVPSQLNVVLRQSTDCSTLYFLCSSCCDWGLYQFCRVNPREGPRWCSNYSDKWIHAPTELWWTTMWQVDGKGTMETGPGLQ